METKNTLETKPLYKLLNESRTQGRAMLYKTVLVNKHLQIGVTSTDDNGATHTILNATNYSSLDTDYNDEWTKKAEANAKYAAMAMNNFANVCEALELMLDGSNAPEWKIKAAKQSLNKIKL